MEFLSLKEKGLGRETGRRRKDVFKREDFKGQSG